MRSSMVRHLTVLHNSIGSATHPWVACTGQVHIQVTMIVTKAAMEVEMMIGMVMGERENGALETMSVMVSMGVMEIAIVEILMNVTAEMVTEMMITGDEVEALMITSMAQEAGVLIERENVLMKMMVNIHLGMPLYVIF